MQSVSVVGLLFSLCAGLLLLSVPRRFAIIPIVVLVCYMTMGERIVALGLNFTMLRILIVFGWVRLIIRSELRGLRWHTADTVLVCWVVVRTVCYTLVWGTSSAFANRLGYAYDIVGSYFFFRYVIRDSEDVYQAIRYLAIFIAPVAMLAVMEKMTGRNPFAVFGGVPMISEVRGGVVRCQGPFSHSILAGSFGATCIPLFVGMWLYRRKALLLAACGAFSSLVIVAMSGSSGPILAVGFGALALGLWPLRKQMRVVRWGILALLVTLHFTMKTPVWFIIARASVFSGSTGWYRGFLIDMTVQHLSDWWLIGTNANATWHYYLADVTNQYIAEGFSGGLLGMALFIGLLGVLFRSVGRTVRSRHTPVNVRYMTWALGAVLISHAVTFISVSYFDQNVIMFYFLLAAITAMGSSAKIKRKQEDPSTHPVMAEVAVTSVQA